MSWADGITVAGVAFLLYVWYWVRQEVRRGAGR